MPENSPSTKLEGLSPEQQADLDRLVQEDETLAYMIRRRFLLTWKNYTEVNWGYGEEPPEDQLDEIGLQIKALLLEIAG